ncbi:hypothetical protein C8J56DRAFT_1011680 [Mycena floridula]|nr:hypothetical protein C8J56DRAFT_1011680 [Mycena floridula]
MLPHQRQMQQAPSNFMPAPGEGYPISPLNAQKQMAALSAANQLRVRSVSQSGAIPGGNFGSTQEFGGHQPTVNTSFLDPTMANARPGQQNLKNRQHGFLNALSNIMAKRNTPLPPALTGVAAPNYDPATSLFKIIEPSAEVGAFRLAGRDIELFKLWGLVVQNGGAQALTANKAWNTLLPHFDLPEFYPEPPANGSNSVAHLLQTYYSGILHPFEEMYRKNIQEQQKRAHMAKQSQPGPRSATATSPDNSAPQDRPSSSVPNPTAPDALPSEPNVFEEVQGLKRKMDPDDTDVKRVRQKTDPEQLENSTPAPSSTLSAGGLGRPSQRRKIEYVPLAREVETYGGRDLRQLNLELTAMSQRRPLREIGDWGIVDIEALTMSIRSRLAIELSYGLTTLSLLSTMKGPTPGSGFPVSQCQDLLEEVLDLLEDLAFGDVEDSFDLKSLDSEPHITTHRELVTQVLETDTDIFASLESRQGSKDPHLGPYQRPGTIILAILNIIRNLSVVADNVDFMSKQYRLIGLILRVCTVSNTSPPSAVSPALSLSDLITARKDALYTLSAIAAIDFSDVSQENKRIANRIFQLVASYLVDESEAISPTQYAQDSGASHHTAKPPALADIALEVFTRLSQSDSNRHALSRMIPRASIRRLFVSLVHRLPVIDPDFQLVMREQWLSYLEKNVMAIYSLAFLAPPDLKTQLKIDRQLGLKSVMLRMIQKFLMTNESRTVFLICLRRTVETLKILDDSEDLFDKPKATGPTIAFGIGYGEVGDNSGERGTGLLGGHRGLTWDLLMLREVWNDPVIFSELESLARCE